MRRPAKPPRIAEIDGCAFNMDGAKLYRKRSLVKAVQMAAPFVVKTLEGTMRGQAWDYLCEGIMGERWAIDRAIFEATYIEALTSTADPG